MRSLPMLLAVVLALAACRHVEEMEADAAPGGDGDADSDAGADSDADSDADTDVDGDADSDTGVATDCPMNSGWPCTCNQVTCDSGDICVGVQGLGDGTAGFCTRECTGDGDCSESFAGQGRCELTADEIDYYCGLFCTGDGQCPPDQDCQSTSFLDDLLCHP